MRGLFPAVVALTLVLPLVPTRAETQRTSRCWAACERNVSDARTRASACTACLTHPEDAAAWLRVASVPLQQLLEDPDWAVRWSGLENQARRSSEPLSRLLGAWLGRSQGPALERACLTAVHGAGRTHRTLAAVLDDPKQLARCEAVRAAIDAQLKVELYDEGATVRRDALEHAAAPLGRAPGRVVLDAVPGHPAQFDALVLGTLSDVASEGPLAGPALLLAAATPGDVEVMNRLLAVYQAQADAARATLSAATDPTQRKDAVLALGRLAPLCEADLLLALQDRDGSIRRSAVRGLARGVGGSIAAAARAFVLDDRKATPEQRLALVRLMGDANEDGCAATALAMWRTTTLDARLRRLALPVAASCRWADARDEVEAQLRANPSGDLAAAIAALAFAPQGPQTWERLALATSNPDAQVRAAACEAIGEARWRGGLDRVVALLKDPEPVVRASAIPAALVLDAPHLDGPLAFLLAGDVSPAVRQAAARALGELGGPRALAALTTAARDDTDPNVKLDAADALRRLGSSRP
ncbi:MAG: HEAT repeat domain-containing protein [Myxococcaceae bacterium]